MRAVLSVLLFIFSAAIELEAQYIISTFAGGGDAGGTPASSLSIRPNSVTVDGAGNVYATDLGKRCIFKITPNGAVYTLVPDGATHVAVDAAGNVYYTDFWTDVVRKVTPSGVNTVIAGTGQGFGGDGGPATKAMFHGAGGIAVDAAGNVYVADFYNYRVRKIDAATGIITTVAGNGTGPYGGGYSGDGGPATNAQMTFVNAVALDSAGNLYIAEGARIRKVDASGTITTIAGNGSRGYSGDGGPAVAAMVGLFDELAADPAGNLYIADPDNKRIRKISAATGIITTAVGDGYYRFAGDGGPASQASLSSPLGVAFDAAGNLYIADTYNNHIRKVSAVTGLISSIAGNGAASDSGDNGPATAARFASLSGLATDVSGNLYLADSMNHRVRKVDGATGIITTVAGTGNAGYSGDGGPAAKAQLNQPTAVTVDGSGNLYILDRENNVIRKVAGSTGVITTVGGPGGPLYVSRPAFIAADPAGALYMADAFNPRVSAIRPSGSVTPVAGTGESGDSGDGGPALSAKLTNPTALGVDRTGNLYIAANGRVRKVTVSTGIISTLAATAGGPLGCVSGLAVDSAGNLYASDTCSSRVRKWIASTDSVVAIAGNGTPGTSGDSGPALSAQLTSTWGIAVDRWGKVFVAQSDRVRALTPTGALLRAAPDPLALSWQPGQADPITTMTVTGGTSITVATDSAWLKAGPGPGPASFRIGATTAGLTPGHYQGSVIVSDPNAVNSPLYVPVTLDPCSYSLSPLSQPLTSAGGAGSFAILADPGCPWSLASTADWLRITSASSGSGGAVATFTAASNPGAARSALISINGGSGAAQSFVVTEDGRALQGALLFVPVPPCRVADTRWPAGDLGGPSMQGGATRSFRVMESGCGIPLTAQAYSLNLTVVPAGPLSYLAAWPSGQSQPFVSTLNSFLGDTVANAAIVPAGLNGAINLYVTDRTDVIIDINGYFAPAGLKLYTAAPCRVADTRSSAAIGRGSTRNFTIAGTCGIPATAQAYSLNVTAVPSGPLGYLTVWPAGLAQPLVSTLNSWKGDVAANAAIVPAGANGAISVYASDATDVVLDINGYFAPPGSGGLNFYAATPCRVADTRRPAGPFGGPPIGDAASRSFWVPASDCSIPASAQAFALNVTVVPPGPLSFLTAWPSGGSRPLVSTLNSFLGKVVANAAIVPAGDNGGVNIYVTNSTDVVLDINGYFAP